MKRYSYIALLASLLVSACGALSLLNPTATSTPLPTNTPEPTLTQTPTPTDTPTPTPTSTPDTAATQAAKATQAASDVLTQLDRYLGNDSGIAYGEGHLLWRQTKPVTISLSGPDGSLSAIDPDVTAGDFVLKSEVTWEATGLLACGAVFRSEPSLEQGKQYHFMFIRFSGLPAWAIEVHQYGRFKNSPTDIRFSSAVDMDNGATNQFILVARGNEFTVHMNGNREGRYFDYSSQRSDGAFAFLGTQTGGDGSCIFQDSWICSLDK